jgi:hypothetical protein
VLALAVGLYTVLHPQVRRSRRGHDDQLRLDLGLDDEDGHHGGPDGRPRETAD